MAKDKKSFYEVSSWSGGLKPGSSINVARQVLYHGERADFKPFLGTPIKELEQRLNASIAEEKKVYDQLQEAVKAWDEHGAQTLLLQKAIEYLKVPVVTHTGNEWKKQKDGSWEISNLVYKMTFSIVKFGDEWKLAWEISYMAPGLQHGYHGYTRTPQERIDHEGSKKYRTLEGAQKYIQLKFDQYAHCFDDLSPPIPAEAKDMFCVNGQLLQGYKIAAPKVQKKEATMDELLGLLDDNDLAPPPSGKQSSPAQGDKAPPLHAAEKNAPADPVAKKSTAPKSSPTKKSAAKKKTAPVR